MASQPSSNTPPYSTGAVPMEAHSAPETGPVRKAARGDTAKATPVTNWLAPSARSSSGRKEEET
eukprot:6935716-Pyramimonas_sp.AAC.1